MSFTHFPVDAALAVVTSTFGPRTHPVTGEVGKQHNGLDLGVGTGTPVLAVGPGTVASTFFEEGGGNVIFVDHDNGLRTAYLHLSSFNCRPGQRVNGGEVIGFSGNTGKFTTGPHLHFEVRRVLGPGLKDERLNPMDFMPGPLRRRDGTLLFPSAGLGILPFALLGLSAYFLAKRRGWI